MTIRFTPAQTSALVESICVGHGISSAREIGVDGRIPTGSSADAEADPSSALVSQLVRFADTGAVIVVRRFGTENDDAGDNQKDPGFVSAVARLVAGKYGRG